MLVVIVIAVLWLFLGSLLFLIIRNRHTALSFGQVLIFFGCKITGGAAYGYVFKRYYNGDDTWKLNHDGFLEYKRLLQYPLLFTRDIFSSTPVPPDNAYYFHPPAYLENLEYSLVTKTIALFDLISQGNYYINIVLFNFFSFWGLYLIYKLVAEQVSSNSRTLAAALLFLFPPAVFWLSGIRAEGWLILFTAIVLYQFNQWIKLRKIRNLLIAGCAMVFVFILRDGFAVLLIPALLAWWLAAAFNTDIKKTFFTVYAIAIAVVAGTSLLPGRWNLLAAVAARQQDFFTLKGNTRFSLAALDNKPLSFIRVLPQALLNTFIRPFAWEAKGPLQWFTSLENTVVLLLGLGTLVIMVRRARRADALTWAFLFISFSNYILIGYIVPFPGAIVRYKIIAELLLMSACFICVKGRTGDDDNR